MRPVKTSSLSRLALALALFTKPCLPRSSGSSLYSGVTSSFALTELTIAAVV